MTASENTSVPPPDFPQPVLAVDGPPAAPHWERTPELSLRALVGAMLLAGALAWGALAIMYYSFVLWASLEAFGMPATVLLSVAVSLKVQQASVYWVTGWRLRLRRLALAAAPGVAVSVAVHQMLSGSMLTRWLTASAVGLAVDSVALSRLLTMLRRRERRS